MHATRVTILDDDADLLDLLRDIFLSEGCVVAAFRDALPGLDEIAASRPELIVVDLGMNPHRDQLSGLQIIHSARSGEKLRDVPIIVSSADPQALADAWPDLMQRGDIHQLAKPFDLETFDRVVQTALGRSHRGAKRAVRDLDREERRDTEG